MAQRYLRLSYAALASRSAGRTAPRVDPAHLSHALDNSVDLFLLGAVLLPGAVGFLDLVLQLLDGHEVLIRNHLPKRFFDRPRTGKDLLSLLVWARNHVDAHQLPDTSGGRRSGFGGGLDRSHVAPHGDRDV